MSGSTFLGYLLAGGFLTNGVPHFVKGITGQRHMTLLQRSSPAPFNVLYGATNFAIGYALLQRTASRDASPALTPRVLAMSLGGLLIAVLLAAFWSDPNARFPWQD